MTPSPTLRDRWSALTRNYPRAFGALLVVALLLVVADGVLIGQRVLILRDTSRVRDQMSAVERERIDAALMADSSRQQVLTELARRQARIDNGLHLSVAVDSGLLHLEQEGAVIHTIPAEIGADGWLRVAARDSVRIAAPRGDRTIDQILGDTAVVPSGCTRIYARSAGDRSGAPPGSVRVGLAAMKVLRPSLRPGQRVYFY